MIYFRFQHSGHELRLWSRRLAGHADDDLLPDERRNEAAVADFLATGRKRY